MAPTAMRSPCRSGPLLAAALFTNTAWAGASLRKTTCPGWRVIRQMTAGRSLPGTRRSQPGTLPMMKPAWETVYDVLAPLPWRTSSRTAGSMSAAAGEGDWVNVAAIPATCAG